MVLYRDDKVSEHSELEIEGENKDRTDWLEDSSDVAPSGCVDMEDDSWRPHLYLCDLQGVLHFEDRRAV